MVKSLSSAALRGALAIVFVTLGAPRAKADTFTETYYFSTGGIATSDIDGNAFLDRSPGQDLLPYTDDDEDLPEGGNSGGTWTFAALDNDGDGSHDRLFSCTRREDDDTLTLSSYSEFHHGVFAEGEDWIDLHDAFNTGPSGDGTLGISAGDDFEWNDRPNWEDQSNWFWYNNLSANQRGMGGSKYYFEHQNGVLEEVQQWAKLVNFQTNADDPNTPLNEKGNNYVRGDKRVTRGLLIPVAAIPGLKDGELDPLFGWQTIDMARYVRDILGPKLDDPGLTIYQTGEGGNPCGRTHSLLPPTFLMIEQGEFEVEIAVEQPDAFGRAAYWGIEPVEPGSRQTSSLFRWCRIMVKGDDEVFDDDFQWNPPIDLVPADGSRENLWLREKFVRQDVTEFDPLAGTGTGLPDSWGTLQLGCGAPEPDLDNTPPDHCWFFYRDIDDAGVPRLEDCQNDYALTLPSGSGPASSWFALMLPLGRPRPDPAPVTLDAAKARVRAEVSVRIEDVAGDGNAIQIILIRRDAEDTRPVAWAELRSGGVAAVGVGGDFTTGGPVSNGTLLSDQGSAAISDIPGVYTLFELVFDARAKTVTLKGDGNEILSRGYADSVGSTVDGIRIWTQSGPGTEGSNENAIYVNEVALLEEVPPSFIRGEVNCDGLTDISDAVSALNYLFSGGEPPCCMAAAEVNGDDSIDISDPVAILTYLFQGGAAPRAPYPFCGVDWSTSLTCETFPPCRDR